MKPAGLGLVLRQQSAAASVLALQAALPAAARIALLKVEGGTPAGTVARGTP